MQIKDDAWVIADTHFGHKKIIDFADRPFSSLAEMDNALTRNWNSVVAKTDQVLVLGDFALAPSKLILKYRSALNGDIVLFLGNHDRNHSARWWVQAGFKAVIEHPIIYKNYFILSHEPVDWVSERLPVMNIHGHIHEKTHYSLNNNHYNVSAERIKYTPVRLSSIINLGYRLASV